MNLVELNENNFILKIKRVDREPSENIQKQVTKYKDDSSKWFLSEHLYLKLLVLATNVQ